MFKPDEAQFRSLLTQVEGLTRLIEDLRVVSLADGGHLSIEIRDADLAADVRAVVDVFAHALQAAGQHPVLDLDTRRMRCDPVRIRQALLALLENARRHAVPGTIRIQTRIEAGMCRLRVEDDGPGIPADFAPHVFKAFRRVDESQPGGSGLGPPSSRRSPMRTTARPSACRPARAARGSKCSGPTTSCRRRTTRAFRLETPASRRFYAAFNHHAPGSRPTCSSGGLNPSTVYSHTDTVPFPAAPCTTTARTAPARSNVRRVPRVALRSASSSSIRAIASLRTAPDTYRQEHQRDEDRHRVLPGGVQHRLTRQHERQRGCRDEDREHGRAHAERREPFGRLLHARLHECTRGRGGHQPLALRAVVPGEAEEQRRDGADADGGVQRVEQHADEFEHEHDHRRPGSRRNE